MSHEQMLPATKRLLIPLALVLAVACGPAPRSEGGIAFTSATRWLAIVLPGPFAETIDGGATWHPYASDYRQAAPIPPQIVFGDASVGYATVRGGLQRTIDGGARWTALKTPGT